MLKKTLYKKNKKTQKLEGSVSIVGKNPPTASANPTGKLTTIKRNSPVRPVNFMSNRGVYVIVTWNPSKLDLEDNLEDFIKQARAKKEVVKKLRTSTDFMLVRLMNLAGFEDYNDEGDMITGDGEVCSQTFINQFSETKNPYTRKVMKYLESVGMRLGGIVVEDIRPGSGWGRFNPVDLGKKVIIKG